MKALVCITSCNRLQEIKKYILPYIDFCNKNHEYDFLLSLDGYDQEYLNFCNQFQIPLLYSDEREGVGLSKNRVLKKFSDYDYYFFIEDDVELFNSNIFQKYIDVSRELNFAHMIVSPPRQFIKSITSNDTTILLSLFGGGYFNFFTAEGIKKIGGWHTLFSKYKRYGHTEHSYRFYHQELIPAPFVVIKECLNYLIYHDPPHVTDLNITSNQNQLIDDEQKLIDEKISFFPVTTLCPFHFNHFNMNNNQYIHDYLQTHPYRYPLLSGKERKNCFSEFYFFRFENSKDFWSKLLFLLRSIIFKPDNNKLKHWLKTKLFFLHI